MRTELLAVRVSKDELVDIRHGALTEGKTISTFLREAALERALEPSESRRAKEEP